MALKFQARGTQLDAYYTGSFKEHALFGPGAANVALAADTAAGVFGQSKINITNGGSNNGGIGWTGLDGFSTVGAFSLLVRIIPTWNNAPAATQGLFCLGGSDGNNFGGFMLRINTSGALNFFMKNATGGTLLNDDSSTVAWVSGTAQDVWVTWDGLTTAGGIKFFTAANGENVSAIGTKTSSGALAARKRSQNAMFMVGQNGFANNGAGFHLNELVVWDAPVTPSSFGVRTDFISATAFEGYVYTNPGAENVLKGVTYTYNGTAFTGTAVSSSGGDSSLGGWQSF